MASEDLFNDFSEEPDLEQELNKTTDEQQTAEVPADDEGETIHATNNGSSETDKTDVNGKSADHEHEGKLTQLPMGRIRNIMKLDPDLQMASNEAVFLVTRAVELFIASLARESFTYTQQSKKKTIQKRDVDLAISAVDSLLFLDGAMNS